MDSSLLVAAAELSLVLAIFLSLRRAIVGLRTSEEPASDAATPPLTVIRPVRGRDPGLEENARAALEQRYDGAMETLFVLDDDSDPALPVLRRAIEASPDTDARIVFAGAPRGECTGKLHAMVRGLEEARLDAPVICFADSDTRPSPELIGQLVARVVSSPEVGSAFAPVVSTQPPRTAGDVAYALLLDGLYGPQAALAMSRHGALPFIMGQTMVLRRSALAAAGGLEASVGQLVDDMHIGARIARAGFRNVLIGAPLPIVQRGLPWSHFRQLARRWLIYSRTGIPFWPFNAPVLAWTSVFFASVLATAIALAAGAFGSAAALALPALAVPVALQRLRRLQGGAPLPARLWWVPVLTLALLPVIYVRAHLARTVVWRGREYVLDDAGTLQASRVPADERRRPRSASEPRSSRPGEETWLTAPRPRDA